MGDVTMTPNAGTVLLLKVASGQVPVSLFKYAELHKQASVVDVLKAVGTGLKVTGQTIKYGTGPVLVGSSLMAPTFTQSATKRVVQPFAAGIGEGAAAFIQKPGEELKKQTDTYVDTLGQNAERMGKITEKIVAPLKNAVTESARESGSAFGSALTDAAIPGMGALAGAGIGGLTGSAMGNMLFSGSKEKDKHRRRMLTLLLAGMGGISGLLWTKQLQKEKLI